MSDGASGRLLSVGSALPPLMNGTNLNLCTTVHEGKVGNITTFELSRGMQMEKTISAAEANRQFSRILRDVTSGQSYVVTSHGRPVARLVPVDHSAAASSAVRDALLSRLS